MEKFNKVLKVIVIVMMSAIIIFMAYAMITKNYLWLEKPKATKAICMSNMKQIYLATIKYASDNGRLPEKLLQWYAGPEIPSDWARFLFPEYLEDANVLRCPKDLSMHFNGMHVYKSSYRINPEVLGKSREEIEKMKTWLIREKEPFHDGKRAVVFTNGAVTLVEEKEKEK